MDGKRRRGKNGGFTLVEVLVACAILGIALTPILTSFVSVARVNATSRKKLTATTVGESVMESVKAFALADFACQCGELNADANNFKLLAGDLEKGTPFSGKAYELIKQTGEKSYAVLAEPSAKKSGSKITFTPSGDRNYCFLIADIPMGGTTYDALVTYEYNAEKSETVIVNDDGSTTPVADTLGTLGVRSLNYYDITVKVWKSVDGEAVIRLDTYLSKSPLCELTGSKTDYN